MKYIITVIIILFTFLTPSEASDLKEAKDIYKQAVEEYKEGNFRQAYELFNDIIDRGYSSFSLYYNTGNAAFKTGDIPSAILNYEKSLLLKPFDEDARYNLEIAKTYTVDKLEVIPEIFFVEWFRTLSLTLRSNHWAAGALFFFTVSVVLLAVFLFSARYRVKKISFAGALTLFILFLFTLGLGLTNRSLTANNNEAIIFEPVVTGSSSPGTGGNELFVIHEGTKVEILDKLGDWYEISLSDGTIGWIPAGNAKKIIP
ncbi:MAG TPA: SH3 domain-containing protein [Bacteroidales bacterium]|nr:SH3 domain-containing protein [Bacteroidales bacterium]